MATASALMSLSSVMPDSRFRWLPLNRAAFLEKMLLRFIVPFRPGFRTVAHRIRFRGCDVCVPCSSARCAEGVCCALVSKSMAMVGQLHHASQREGRLSCQIACDGASHAARYKRVVCAMRASFSGPAVHCGHSHLPVVLCLLAFRARSYLQLVRRSASISAQSEWWLLGMGSANGQWSLSGLCCDAPPTVADVVMDLVQQRHCLRGDESVSWQRLCSLTMMFYRPGSRVIVGWMYRIISFRY